MAIFYNSLHTHLVNKKFIFTNNNWKYTDYGFLLNNTGIQKIINTSIKIKGDLTITKNNTTIDKNNLKKLFMLENNKTLKIAQTEWPGTQINIDSKANLKILKLAKINIADSTKIQSNLLKTPSISAHIINIKQAPVSGNVHITKGTINLLDTIELQIDNNDNRTTQNFHSNITFKNESYEKYNVLKCISYPTGFIYATFSNFPCFTHLCAKGCRPNNFSDSTFEYDKYGTYVLKKINNKICLYSQDEKTLIKEIIPSKYHAKWCYALISGGGSEGGQVNAPNIIRSASGGNGGAYALVLLSFVEGTEKYKIKIGRGEGSNIHAWTPHNAESSSIEYQNSSPKQKITLESGKIPPMIDEYSWDNSTDKRELPDWALEEGPVYSTPATVIKDNIDSTSFVDTQKIYVVMEHIGALGGLGIYNPQWPYEDYYLTEPQNGESVSNNYQISPETKLSWSNNGGIFAYNVNGTNDAGGGGAASIFAKGGTRHDYIATETNFSEWNGSKGSGGLGWTSLGNKNLKQKVGKSSTGCIRIFY